MLRTAFRHYAIPLGIFFIIGAGLHWVESRWSSSFELPSLSPRPEKRITISENELSQLASAAQNSKGRILRVMNNKILLAEGLALGIGDSDPVTIERLNLNMQFLSSKDEAESDITSRYEAAMALGMVETDPIVQRRIIQLNKQYLLRNLTGKQRKAGTGNSAFEQYPLPTDAQLNDYLQRHKQQFEKPERWSFSQLFLDPKKQSNQSSKWFSDLLTQLNEGASFKGNVSILPRELSMLSRQQISQQFGHNFATSLDELEIGRWMGPIKSSYGNHMVKVEEKVSARPAELKEVYNRAVIGWQEENRKQVLENHLAALRESYRVSIARTQSNPAVIGELEDNLTVAQFVANIEQKIAQRRGSQL